MARQRVAGYITKQESNNFGLEVSVKREVLPKSELYPSGDPVPDGKPGFGGNYRSTDSQKYRDPIPPGVIGSEAEENMTNPPLQYVDTAPYERGEQVAPHLHGSVNSLRSGDANIAFNAYGSFEPRSAPMPRARQDDGILGKAPYQADPLMTDEDSTINILERNANKKDMFGKNRDGVLHNENSHPGFGVVQGRIEKEGYSKEAAGAILANSTRHASAAAKKANPNLKRVK